METGFVWALILKPLLLFIFFCLVYILARMLKEFIPPGKFKDKLYRPMTTISLNAAYPTHWPLWKKIGYGIFVLVSIYGAIFFVAAVIMYLS